MAYTNQADGSGRLDIGGVSWPVSYQIVSEEESDGARTVHIELSAPRDWLLKRGFTSEAKLIRENGAEIDIRSPGAISTGDPLAILLRSEALHLPSEDEAFRQFPELTTH